MVPKKSIVQSALYLKDAQLFLDECIRTHETVPRSGQTRKVRDVLIFMINNHPVYI